MGSCYDYTQIFVMNTNKDFEEEGVVRNTSEIKEMPKPISLA